MHNISRLCLMYIARNLHRGRLYGMRLELIFLDASDKFSTTHQPPWLLHARAARMGWVWRVKVEY